MRSSLRVSTRGPSSGRGGLVVRAGGGVGEEEGGTETAESDDIGVRDEAGKDPDSWDMQQGWLIGRGTGMQQHA